MRSLLLFLTLVSVGAQDIFVPFFDATGNRLLTDLVAFWQLNKPAQASPGGDEPDSSGHGYTLLQNPSGTRPTSGTGVVGFSRGFSGTDPADYLYGNFPEVAFAFTNDFTITAWCSFAPRSPATDDFTIVSRGNVGTDPGPYNFSYLFELDSGSQDDYLAFYWSTDGHLNAGNRIAKSVGEVSFLVDWFFVYIRREGANLYINATYKNDPFDPAAEVSQPFGAGALYKGGTLPVRLGRWDTSNVHDMNGQIDEMGFWNRSLSPCELKYLFSAKGGVFTYLNFDPFPCANPP
jgi:Concanavalin A-like lectin/glucanases superfamily